LVEVESADPVCSEDGPLLGLPRLPVRPRSQPAVCAVVENGATIGAMIAGTDAKASSLATPGRTAHVRKPILGVSRNVVV
jgi:hypothetical protein